MGSPCIDEFPASWFESVKKRKFLSFLQQEKDEDFAQLQSQMEDKEIVMMGNKQQVDELKSKCANYMENIQALEAQVNEDIIPRQPMVLNMRKESSVFIEWVLLLICNRAIIVEIIIHIFDGDSEPSIWYDSTVWHSGSILV